MERPCLALISAPFYDIRPPLTSQYFMMKGDDNYTARGCVYVNAIKSGASN
jgi:hypothetical protein